MDALSPNELRLGKGAGIESAACTVPYLTYNRRQHSASPLRSRGSVPSIRLPSSANYIRTSLYVYSAGPSGEDQLATSLSLCVFHLARCRLDACSGRGQLQYYEHVSNSSHVLFCTHSAVTSPWPSYSVVIPNPPSGA